MPVTYKYDPGSNILHAYQTGIQTVADVCDYFKKITHDPTIHEGFFEVVHFSDDVEFDFNSHTARIIPIRFAEMKNKKHIKVTILIGATQLQYGIARMMKNLHELYEPADDIRVVRTQEEAQREIDSIILAKNDLLRIACG
ncbi:MAG: hypothetical protein KKA54_02930 [Proteobacteria bacterium]|nr:hypothetical protein [Pseudomonadota bacterium]